MDANVGSARIGRSDGAGARRRGCSGPSEVLLDEGEPVEQLLFVNAPRPPRRAAAAEPGIEVPVHVLGPRSASAHPVAAADAGCCFLAPYLSWHGCLARRSSPAAPWPWWVAVLGLASCRRSLSAQKKFSELHHDRQEYEQVDTDGEDSEGTDGHLDRN